MSSFSKTLITRLSVLGATLAILVITPVSVSSQINNKVEGITLKTPCELEYTRNIGDQNNYSCVYLENDKYVLNYSVTIDNLYNEMNGLDEKSLKSFKSSYLETVVKDASSRQEEAEYLDIGNGVGAVKSRATIDYSGDVYEVTAIVFVHKQKGYFVNLVTNAPNLASEYVLRNCILLN